MSRRPGSAEELRSVSGIRKECDDRDDHDGDNVDCGSCHAGAPFDTTLSVSYGTGRIAPVKDPGLAQEKCMIAHGEAEIDWGQTGRSSYDRTHAEL